MNTPQKKLTYIERVQGACIDANHAAMLYGDGKAWNNRKAKTRKMYVPRGKCFKRMEEMQRDADWRNINEGLEFLLDSTPNAVHPSNILEER